MDGNIEEDKKIVFDLTFLFDQYSKRGIGVYGKNVLNRLFKKIITENSKYEIHLLGFRTLNENLAELGFSQFNIEEITPHLSFHSLGSEFDSSLKNKKIWIERYLPILNEIQADYYYAVHFERGLPSHPELSSLLNKKPKTIVVVHDVIPFVINKYSSRGFIANFVKKRFYKDMWKGISNADLAITVSNFSKQDIIKYGGIDEKKIKVIYLGVDEKFGRDNYKIDKELEDQILEIYSLQNKFYFFYDTGIEANKGSRHLLSVFKEILNLNSLKLPNYLVITGKDFQKGEGFGIKPRTVIGDDFLNLAKRLGVAQNIITTDRIPDDHLVTLLANAKAYLNLSTYEGFGLGIAQAMKAEVPVVAANASCIPEIAQDGALLIDLKKDMDYKQSATLIQDHFMDEDNLKATINRGKKIASSYNWESTVEKTWAEISQL